MIMGEATEQALWAHELELQNNRKEENYVK
jgi:hypothetical protein